MASEWKEITTIEQWNAALEGSMERDLVVFKHSTTCPVSFNAHDEFQRYLQTDGNPGIDYVFVKVIESRPVSNKIAEDTGITHASPQAICIKKKASYWNTSHWSITKAHLTAVLN